MNARVELSDMAPAAVAPAPVVIVGAGPAGVRVAQDILRHAPLAQVVLYGEEPQGPYNRVRLSAFVAAQIDGAGLMLDQTLPAAVATRYGCSVVSIDCASRHLVDATGRVQAYSRLVLATGSLPFVPDIEGLRRDGALIDGAFTFRNLDDAERLMARQGQCRRAVILGGGLLGLEAARAMLGVSTEVTVIELADRLMPRQLDREAADQLRAHVEAAGIQVRLAASVRCVRGGDHITGVELDSGETLACDTLVIATGIVPRVDLARAAGLAVGRGVRVDARLRSSDPNIYAIGECAEHPERRAGGRAGSRIYGAAWPSLEQAAVAAREITGVAAAFKGAPVPMRLKVLATPVFSMGRVREDTLLGARETRFRATAGGIYRKLSVQRGRLVGAAGIGEWEDLGRIQEALVASRRLWPWQRWRFARTGSPWCSADAQSVNHWPARAAVCNCTGVTRGQLSAAIASGVDSVAQLSACTGAASVCGSCKPLLAEMLGAAATREPAWGWRVIVALALLAGLATLLYPLLGAIEFSTSVRGLRHAIDALWRDGLLKQISGFSLLASVLAAAALGLRKRLARLAFGRFERWQAVHIAIGALAPLLLLAHTGLRLGQQLNFALMANFIGVLVVGAGTGAVLGLEHRLAPLAARRLRRGWHWAHIVFLWPLPVLIGYHVLSVYYF